MIVLYHVLVAGGANTVNNFIHWCLASVSGQPVCDRSHITNCLRLAPSSPLEKKERKKSHIS